MKKFYLMYHLPTMIKEVGKGREAEIQKTINSCEQIGSEIDLLDVETIIISPHRIVFSDGIGVVVTDKLKEKLNYVYIGNISEEERKYITSNN
ncbi:MAG: hypothetical protein ACRC92_16865 [Peptostreptococcaceae bacterium]